MAPRLPKPALLTNPEGKTPQRSKHALDRLAFAQHCAGTGITKMMKLKARGVGFSLDNFGTGLSSLSHLRQLPLDELKIAGAFVKDVCTNSRDAELARAFLSLSRSLGIAVIAEGVETAAQESDLARQGCKAFQGCLFGRPAPAS